jgi:hypothetical protein
MERTDIVDAQFVTTTQLKAIRDRIVVDRMQLVKAVTSLYPNFNVSDAQNLQNLRTSLENEYPEITLALDVANQNSVVKFRTNELRKLRDTYNISSDVVTIQVDFTKIPTGSNFAQFKSRALEILGYQLDTERLRNRALSADKRVPNT